MAIRGKFFFCPTHFPRTENAVNGQGRRRGQFCHLAYVRYTNFLCFRAGHGTNEKAVITAHNPGSAHASFSIFFFSLSSFQIWPGSALITCTASRKEAKIFMLPQLRRVEVLTPANWVTLLSPLRILSSWLIVHFVYKRNGNWMLCCVFFLSVPWSHCIVQTELPVSTSAVFNFAAYHIGNTHCGILQTLWYTATLCYTCGILTSCAILGWNN